MRQSSIFLIFITSLILMNESVYAGAWTQKRGGGYYKIGVRVIRADRFYEPDGNKITIPTLGDYTTSFYGEYGLYDWLTVVANVPFFKRITLNEQVGRPSGFVYFEGDSKSGFGDSDIGVRVGLLRSGKSVLSTEALFGLPIGDDSQTNGLLTGDGEFNQLLKLQFGYSFYPKPIYFTSEVGFNNRTGGYSDEFHYAAEIGYTFKNNIFVIFRIRGVESLKNGDGAVVGGMAGLFANNQSYLSYGPEINYTINNTFGISAGIEGATRGENVLSAPAFLFGFFVKK